MSFAALTVNTAFRRCLHTWEGYGFTRTDAGGGTSDKQWFVDVVRSQGKIRAQGVRGYPYAGKRHWNEGSSIWYWQPPWGRGLLTGGTVLNHRREGLRVVGITLVVLRVIVGLFGHWLFGRNAPPETVFLLL